MPGNPPYQHRDEGAGSGASPIYPAFCDFARKWADVAVLIHPARCLSDAGKTPKAWNCKLLTDPHICVIDHWADASEVFGDDVDVKGGVAVTMFDRENEVGLVGRFVADPTLKGIVDVVTGQMSASLADIVRSRSSYKLGMAVYEEHPSLRGVQSKGHDRDVGWNVFAKLADVFSDEPRGCDDVAVVGREGGRRVTKHLPSRYLVTPDNFDGFKVIVCKANGSGTVGEALSDPRVIGPKVGHTDTFLSIGNFETAGEAEAALAYIKTKFVRVLLGSLKVTQDNSRAVWRNVPMGSKHSRYRLSGTVVPRVS